MRENTIEVRDFSYSFGMRKVLHSVNVTAKKGEYISILGPNGAGKTTLLKNIIRILTKGEGSIKVKGRDLKEFSQRQLAKEISYVPQPDGRRYPFLVGEFILMSKYPYMNPFSRITEEDQGKVEEALAAVRMSRFKDRDMNTLSSGERQKIMIAASLAQKSDIFLLDEPTTFLDPKHEEEINRILKRLNGERNITILSVTHNLNLAVILSDKILALKEGKAFYWGEAQGFMDRTVLKAVYGKDFKLTLHPDKDIKIILPEIIC